MYIQPNSVVRLLKGVKLDSTYSDTLFFESLSNQTSHFISNYTHKIFNSLTYQRVNKNKMRLQVKADTIYDYNYLMFQNTSYGNKWFYAFIKSVEYVNDNTTEITYEIDVMQTWFFDYTVDASFVEREHSDSDIIGENIAPESVDLGPVICEQVIKSNYFDSYSIVVATAKEEEP